MSRREAPPIRDRRCENCGSRFVGRRKICPSCWRKKSNVPLLRDPLDDVRQRLELAEAQMAELVAIVGAYEERFAHFHERLEDSTAPLGYESAPPSEFVLRPLLAAAALINPTATKEHYAQTQERREGAENHIDQVRAVRTNGQSGQTEVVQLAPTPVGGTPGVGAGVSR